MSHDLSLTLREQVRRIERPIWAAHGVVPFGIAAIDNALPGGGLARGALHEILGAGGDEEDGALAAAFAASIVAGLASAKDGIVLWCLARPDLYGPGLAAHRLDPARLVMVRAARDTEILWAMEEGLHTSGVTAVVGEIGTLSDVASRRLQLAAEHSGATAFVLRRWRNGGQAARERALPNAAATRWRVAALSSQPIPVCLIRSRLHPLPFPPPQAGEGMGGGMRWREQERIEGEEPGIGYPHWRVELLRCRGGEPACWEVEIREGKMADATNSISLVGALADRPKAPVGSEAAASERIYRTG
jgi:protein ImuA